MKITRTRFIQGIVKAPKFHHMTTMYSWRPEMVIVCGCMPLEPEPPDVNPPHWWYPFLNMSSGSRIPLAVEDAHPAMRMSVALSALSRGALAFCFSERSGATGGGFLEPQMRTFFDM